MQNNLFIGIDFGTTNSSIAWFNPKDEKAEVLSNAESETKTPSVVYFGPDETIVGSPVELLLEDFKSLDEEDRQGELMRIVPSIKRKLLNPPLIPLPDGRDVRPVEVVAEILRKLKRDAEAEHFHATVEHAVITCPAVFDTKQRGKILEAAKLAGFKEVELLEEPVAAALAFAHSHAEMCENVLVYDLGGGTFDLAVVAREGDNTFRLVMETDGDAHCGGDDFDQALYNFWDAQARKELGKPISPESGQLDSYFLRECRRRKELLSMKTESAFSSLLAGGKTFRPKVTRVAFEELIRPQLEKTVRKTAELYHRARNKGFDVDTIVMIGGSTRIPLVENMLKEVLGIEPRRWLNKDVAVALGAAYHARELWSPKPLVPTNLVVSARGDGHYRTLSEAVAKARPGSRVAVRPGIYRERVVIDKQLEIVADGGAGEVVIESTEHPCISMETERALVRGFTLRAKTGLDGASANTVELRRGQLVLEDCDVASDAGECIHVEGASTSPIVRKCRIHSAKEQGVFFTEGAKGLLEDCDIYGNTMEGIGIVNGASPVINRCKVHNSVIGVAVANNGRGTFEDCEIYDNTKFNVAVGGEGDPIIRRCKLHGGGEDDGGSVAVMEKGKGRFEACDIYGVGLGFLVADGGEPFLTGSRVYDCQRGVIFGAGGLGTIENCEIFRNEEMNVMMLGGSPVIRKCGIHDSRHYGLYIGESGAGTFQDCEIYRNSEANVFITDNCDPTIRGCRISDGENVGVAVQNTGQGTFDNCDIFGHQVWNVGIIEGGDPNFQNCRIHSSKKSGIRIFSHGSGTLRGCDIYGNAEAQIVIADESNPIVLSCKIRGGGNVGVFITEGGRGHIEDCDITENKGGGVGISERGNPAIHRCRIRRNKVGVGVLPGGVGTIKNCDLSDNEEGAWAIEAPDQSVVRSDNTVDVDEEIKRVLKRFEEWDDFFVRPNIPAGKLSNASEACRTKAQMPNWEEVLALLDCTVFGSAKDCVIFARKGIYFTNSGTTGAILYRDFPNKTFKTSGLYVEYERGRSINVAGSAQGSQQVMQILNSIKQIY